MNFFELKLTQYDGIYIKPMNIKQSLALSDVEDKNDKFFTPCIYCLCKEDGTQCFNTLDEFYNYFPSYELNNIVDLIIKTNNPISIDTQSKEKNVS